MGRLHPHGDSAIYDALVRMAQPWAMRLPLIDGHGNFGSLGGDDAPAAMRYTEARLAAAAMEMIALARRGHRRLPAELRRHRDRSPTCSPPGLPNLLVNGAAGIAVGMATNMAPHNLGEVIAAARHLIRHPDADLDALMRFVPGPDLPTGGKIVGLDGIRDAYDTGRGIFRTRATARVEKLTPRRTGLVVTELPYGVGPEKVISRIKDLVQAKKLNGIADLKDLTDRHRGLQLVIELRSGFVARGGAGRAVPADADGRDVRHQQRRAGGRAAAAARPARAAGDLRRPPDRRGPPPHRVPPHPRARTGCT